MSIHPYKLQFCLFRQSNYFSGHKTPVRLKPNTIAILAMAFFSVVAGYLLSGISLIGRVGINLMYKEYRFLKTWWKGAILVFIVWLILFIIQMLVQKRATKAVSNIVHAVLLVIAVAGLYSSYADFRHTTSHRWLGERFHLGVYLFWIGWIAISIFTLMKKRSDVVDNMVVERTIV